MNWSYKKFALKVLIVFILVLLSFFALTSCFLIKKTLQTDLDENIEYDYEKGIITWKNDNENIGKWEYKILDDISQEVASDEVLANNKVILKLNNIKSLIGGNNYKLVLVAKSFSNIRYKDSDPYEFKFFFPHAKLDTKFNVGISKIADEYYFSFLDSNNAYDWISLKILNMETPFYTGEQNNINNFNNLIKVEPGTYKIMATYIRKDRRYLPYAGTQTINIAQTFKEEFPNYNVQNSDLRNGGIVFDVNNVANLESCLVFDKTNNQLISDVYIVCNSGDNTILLLKNYFDNFNEDERYAGMLLAFKKGIYVVEIEVVASDTREPVQDNNIVIARLLSDHISPRLPYKKYKYRLDSVEYDGSILNSTDYQIVNHNISYFLKIVAQPSSLVEIGDTINASLTFKDESDNQVVLDYIIKVVKETTQSFATYNQTYYSDISVEKPTGNDLEINVLTEKEENADHIRLFYHKDLELSKSDDYTIRIEDDNLKINLKPIFLRKFNIGEVVEFTIEGINLQDNKFMVRFIRSQFKLNFLDDLYTYNDWSNLDVLLSTKPESNIQFNSYEINGKEYNDLVYDGDLKITLPQSTISQLQNGKYRIGIIYTATFGGEPYAYYFTLYKNVDSLKLGSYKYLSSKELVVDFDCPMYCDLYDIKVKINGVKNDDIVKVYDGKIVIDPRTLTGKSFMLSAEYDDKFVEKSIKLITDPVLLAKTNEIFYNAGKQYNLYIDDENELNELIIYILKNGNNYSKVGHYGILNIEEINGSLNTFTRRSTVLIDGIYLAYNPNDQVKTFTSKVNAISVFYHHGYKVNVVVTETSMRFTIYSTGTPSSRQVLGAEYYENHKEHEAYYAGRPEFPKRSSSFAEFKIDSKEETPYLIEFSDDLVDAISNGLKPQTKPNSNAEKIYQKAREILKNIISDSMTDYEKIVAMVNWLADNLSYDHEIVKESNESIQYQHPSFFLEGVFLLEKRYAVCDAYTKTLTLFAGIEGIDAVRISGQAKERHAWSKLRIYDYWYFVDSTWSDPLVELEEGFDTTYLFIPSYYVEQNNLLSGKIIKQHEQDAGYDKYSCVDTQFLLYANLRFRHDGVVYNRVFSENDDDKMSAYKEYYEAAWGNESIDPERGCTSAFKSAIAVNQLRNKMSGLIEGIVDTMGDLSVKDCSGNQIWTFYKKAS